VWFRLRFSQRLSFDFERRILDETPGLRVRCQQRLYLFAQGFITDARFI
jgi:hypothetical protein